MSVTVELTDAEAAAIVGQLSHSPHCIWSITTVAFHTDDAGNQWADESCTIPFREPPCSCGYFGLRRSAEAKIAGALR